MAVLYAHTGADGTLEHGQLLLDHLRAVAERARLFAEPIGAGGWAYWVGMLHDAGKASEDFQHRLQGDARSVDHATGGAQLAVERYGDCGRLLAFPIAGHHGGMANWESRRNSMRTPLKERLGKKGSLPSFRAAYEQLVHLPLPEELGLPKCFTDREIQCLQERAFGLYLTEQMIFSALVDADYLDTESVMSPAQALARTSNRLSLGQLTDLLDAHMEELAQSSGGNPSPVNRVRAEVLRQCIGAADSPGGLFSLEVPTGGGKTLAALSFALHHALRNGQKRVIIAIPFTSIVEQTALTLKHIFGPENVLEHHSTYDYEKVAGAGRAGEELDDERVLRERLLVQNWDAPIIVTTNVQLFESLFSNKPSRCRKVHNVAKSVVILDEVQTLPDHLLRPTLAMLQVLCDYADVTALLCTATQPAFDECWPFPSRPRAIVDDKGGKLFAPLMNRVAYETDRTGENPLLLGELVDMLVAEKRALCVVSSRGAARQVYEAVRNHLGSTEGLYHLSGLMIPAHRSLLIESIRARLAEEAGGGAESAAPCRVISTQLIEAGVDVDFPIVFREAAGIDSIIQAAGRCNREGGLGRKGRVIVFECPEFGQRGEVSEPEEEALRVGGATGKVERTWLGKMRAIGLETIKEARDEGFDAFGPKGVRRFFLQRYGTTQGFALDVLDAAYIYRSIAGNRDGYGSEAASGTFSFETYARGYRFIPEEGEPIFIPWGEGGRNLLSRIESGEISSDLQRALQRYTVAVPKWAFGKVYAGCVRRMGPFNVLEDRVGSEHLYSEELGLLTPGDGEYDLLVM